MNNGYTVFYRCKDSTRMAFFEDGTHLLEWLNSASTVGFLLRDAMEGNGLRGADKRDVEAMLAGRHSQFPEDSFLVINGSPIQLKKKQVTTIYELP